MVLRQEEIKEGIETQGKGKREGGREGVGKDVRKGREGGRN